MSDATLSDDSVALGETDPAHHQVERPPPHAESPRRIDRFTLLERLGEGGVGEVYAAYDERLDRKVAVKLLRTSRPATTRDRARLQREARSLAQLSHPNIVAVYDTGVHEGEVYIAMEFVRGATLEAWLGEARTWWEIVRVFLDAGRGLAAMHAIGLVHRDFKPTNVLIDTRGAPRLIDFGLVKIDDDGADLDDGVAPQRVDSLTRTGAIMGTPRYMSPEQFSGAHAGPASDQFSLCVALFGALYGEDPFPGETFQQRSVAVRVGARPDSPKRRDLPTELEALVVRGLASDPAGRWANMNQLCDALAAVLGVYEHSEADPAARRTQRRVILSLAGLTTAFVATGLALVDLGAVAFSPLSATLTDGLVLSATGALAVALREHWQSSRRARRMVQFFFLVVSTYAMQDLIGLLAGRSLYHTVIGNLGCLVLFCAFMAAREGRAFALAAVWASAGVTAMLLDPDRYFAYFTAGNLGSAVIAAFVFRHQRAHQLDGSETWTQAVTRSSRG